MATPSTRRGLLAPTDLGVLGGIVVAGVFLLVVGFRAPRTVGGYLDDGIYLVTSKSLLEGHGYRHQQLPGEPQQTKYQMLYPLVLAGIWAAAAEFPANVPAFMVLNAACWALGSWLAYCVMRRTWGLAWWIAAGGVALGFLNPVTITVVISPMSEPFYLLLSTAALWVLAPPAVAAGTAPPRGATAAAHAAAPPPRTAPAGTAQHAVAAVAPAAAHHGAELMRDAAGRSGGTARASGGPEDALQLRPADAAPAGTGPTHAGGVAAASPTATLNASAAGASKRLAGRETRRALLAGALAAGAYLTRSVGLALVLALPLALVLRRRYRSAVLSLALGACAIAGWSAWRGRALAANNADPVARAFRYDLDYRAWVAGDLGTATWVVYQNISALAVTLFALLVPIPGPWIDGALERGPAAALPLYAGMAALVIMLLVGLGSVFRRDRAELHLYLVGALGLMLAWPYVAARLFLPLAPFLAAVVLAGVFVVTEAVFGLGARLGASSPAKRRAVPAGNAADRWAKGRPGSELAFRLVAILVLAAGFVRGQQLVNPGTKFIAEAEKQERTRVGLAEFIRTRTAPDAVISANWGGYLHLRTGRKIVPHLPYESIIQVMYPRDRKFSGCGRVVTRAMRAADLELARNNLLDYLRLTGATHIVPPDEDSTYVEALTELRRRYPSAFELIGTVESSKVYRFKPVAGGLERR